MTNTPSETEIDNLLCKHWPGYSRQAVLVKMWLREAIKSAIAKWGTPQPVVREPLPKFLALKFHTRRDKNATVSTAGAR